MNNENLNEYGHTAGRRQPEDLAERQAGSDTEPLDPVLQQQVDENLQLLYRSKLEEVLPQSLQALVQQLLDGGKPHERPS